MMMAAQPGLVFLIIFADDVFRIVFGPHWQPAAAIFQWLGVCGLQQIMIANSGWLFVSQGRGADFFKLGLFNAIVTVVSFVVGLPWGPVGVAMAYTISSYLAHVPATIWWTCRSGPIRVADLISCALPHVAATCASGAVLFGAAVGLPSPSPIACIALALLSYAVYGAIMLMSADKRRILGANFRAFFGMLPALGRT